MSLFGFLFPFFGIKLITFNFPLNSTFYTNSVPMLLPSKDGCSTEEQAVNIMRKPQAGKICQIHPALHQHCYVPSRLLNTEMFKWCLGGAGLCLGFPAGSRVEQCVCHVVCAIILLMGFEDLERISLSWGGMHSALFKRSVIKAQITKVPLQNSIGLLFLRSGIL